MLDLRGQGNRTAWIALKAAAPFAAAALLVPHNDMDGPGCGAPSDGGIGCAVFGTWVPWVTAVCVVGALLHGAVWTATVWAPRTRRRWAAGERLRLNLPSTRAGVDELAGDPLLAAASWAHVTHQEHAAGTTGAFGWARAARRIARRTTAGIDAPEVSPRVVAQRVALTGTGAVLRAVEGGGADAAAEASRAPVVRIVEAGLSRTGLAGLAALLHHVHAGDGIVCVLRGSQGLTPGGVAALRRQLQRAAADGVHVVLAADEARTRAALTGAELGITLRVYDDRRDAIDAACATVSGEPVGGAGRDVAVV